MSNNKVLPAEKKPCPMCMNQSLGASWTQAIIRGDKTSVEAASALKMSIEDVDKHVYKHTTPQTIRLVKSTKSRDKDSFLDQLDGLNDKLNASLEEIMLKPELDTRQLTGLTKEIRETLKLLAEVAGVIGADNSAAMQKNLTEMQQKYLTLTGLILEEACPLCQQKIVARLKGEQGEKGAKQIT